MREILFRGKRIDNEEWVEGSLITDVFMRGGQDVPYILCPGKAEYDCFEDFDEQNGIFEVDPSTICQYTGLTDKNGRKIWENDITKLVLPDGEIRYFKVSFQKVIRKVLCHPDFDDYVAKVELNAICFEWNGYELFPCIDENGLSDVSKMEVVGNIFDNPELMEGE